MATARNGLNFHFHSPYAQQKLKNIACFWERQPSGCVRINCAFHHSKPRHINGLFLPPTNNAPLPQGDQEGILPPAQCEGSLTSPENILRPIHPPLIIKVNDEEDDEEDSVKDNEEICKVLSILYKQLEWVLSNITITDVSDWVPKTAEDIEEERAIKEICYKSGEFYGIQQPDQQQSPNPVSPSQETELLPLEATQWDLQKGKYFSLPQTMDDSNTIPPELNNTSREGESTGRRVPEESTSRTGCRSFENGGKILECEFLMAEYYLINDITVYIWIRVSTINIFLILSFSLQSPAVCQIFSNSTTILFVFSLLESHTAEPNAQPSYQPKDQFKDGENDSLPNVREPGRKTYFLSSEPRRSAYVVYRTVTVTQEPKFSRPRAVPEPSVWKCSKGKNEPGKNRRFWTQTGNYDKYTSGSYNAPTWRRRNPQAKIFSKTKTTIQSQKDMEVNHKWEQSEDKREMKQDLELTRTT
ncbi:uncharacterized protein C12orf50 homolog [Ara ararauna]